MTKKLLPSILPIVVSLFCLSESNLWAAEGSSRSAHRFGFYGSLLGEPFPSLWGINLGINIASWMRIHGGYGSISASTVDATTLATATLSLTTIGGGVNFFLPHASFSPTVGVGYSIVNLTATGNVGSLTVAGFSASQNVLTVSGGIDWQAGNGFNLGAGYSYSPTISTGAPYISLGWFF